MTHELPEDISITQQGIGTSDGCWIWYRGCLYQIHQHGGEHEEIHGLELHCRKGDWSLVVLPVVRSPRLWNTLASILLENTNVNGRVV